MGTRWAVTSGPGREEWTSAPCWLAFGAGQTETCLTSWRRVWHHMVLSSKSLLQSKLKVYKNGKLIPEWPARLL